MFASQRHLDSVEYVGITRNTGLIMAKRAGSALYEDACLYIVPGSHRRLRDGAQRTLSSASEPPKNPLDMPGSLQVTLKRALKILL